MSLDLFSSPTVREGLIKKPGLMPESLKSVSSFDLLDVSGFFMPFMLFMVTRLKRPESTWCLSLDLCETGQAATWNIFGKALLKEPIKAWIDVAVQFWRG
ncbi:MAG: hypothetical protein DMG06_21605 [Acidobacteria bacterium]|nr:MAG: hypothetical protein DMG06_21605 [Acidobacteriota bacterium]